MLKEVQRSGIADISAQISSAEGRVESTLRQLRLAEEKLAALTSYPAADEQQASKLSPAADWTKSYKKWDSWNKVETFGEEVEENRNAVEGLSKKVSSFSHSHDHSEERKIFELPEQEKLSYCERHRAKGNYLFHEGIYPKAAEQYQLALSYYEYCFPDAEAEQKHLDSLRVTCLCNISLCYFRLGCYRDAVGAATKALDEGPVHVKALHHRAKAYACLHEYE